MIIQGGDFVSEKQKQLVEGILSDSYEMSEAYQQRLIGVAYGLEISQGLGMVPGPQENDETNEDK